MNDQKKKCKKIRKIAKDEMSINLKHFKTLMSQKIRCHNILSISQDEIKTLKNVI